MNSGDSYGNNSHEQVLVEVCHLLNSGLVNPALHLLNSILSIDPCHAAALTYVAGIYLRIGQYQELKHNLLNAYKSYVRALLYKPNQEQVQARLLELLPEYIRCTNSDDMQSNPVQRTSPGRLVLGIGTGRSGSTSLARLLSVQHDTYISHEHPPRLPWLTSTKRFRFHCYRLKKILSMKAYVGDVAHWWLPYLPDILVLFPNARIICLRRDQAATVRSFETIKGSGKGSVNHWITHDNNYWSHAPLG